MVDKPDDWSRFGTCTECGAERGSACMNLTRTRNPIECAKPHKMRPRTRKKRVWPMPDLPDAPKGHKACWKCKTVKPLDEFWRFRHYDDGLDRVCKACYKSPETARKRKRAHVKYMYGITLEEYEELMTQANGVCPICTRESDDLHLDHDHDSGKIRGFICGKCNRGLGLFAHSYETLTNAAEFIRRNS